MWFQMGLIPTEFYLLGQTSLGEGIVVYFGNLRKIIKIKTAIMNSRELNKEEKDLIWNTTKRLLLGNEFYLGSLHGVFGFVKHGKIKPRDIFDKNEVEIKLIDEGKKESDN